AAGVKAPAIRLSGSVDMAPLSPLDYRRICPQYAGFFAALPLNSFNTEHCAHKGKSVDYTWVPFG
ncbi:hypothetical protein, partial [Escherichia coli]|uniref:hypothetical protein n=2 Tax=Escherichia coli TaxID=562 RepID=UPI0022E400D1